MRSQKSIVRKAAKAKARRKSFERAHNINRNVPSIVREEQKEKFEPVFSEKTVQRFGVATVIRREAVFETSGKKMKDGSVATIYTPRLKHVGYKTVQVKEKVYAHTDKHGRPVQPDGLRARGLPYGMIPYAKQRKYLVPLKKEKALTK